MEFSKITLPIINRKSSNLISDEIVGVQSLKYEPDINLLSLRTGKSSNVPNKTVGYIEKYLGMKHGEYTIEYQKKNDRMYALLVTSKSNKQKISAIDERVAEVQKYFDGPDLCRVAFADGWIHGFYEGWSEAWAEFEVHYI